MNRGWKVASQDEAGRSTEPDKLILSYITPLLCTLASVSMPIELCLFMYMSICWV